MILIIHRVAYKARFFVYLYYSFKVLGTAAWSGDGPFMAFYTWLELGFFGFGDVLPIKSASLRHKKLDVLQQCDSRQEIDTLGIIHDRTVRSIS